MTSGRILATVTGAQILNVASTTSIAVALPEIGRDLGADDSELQWIVDAFVLVFASLVVAGGVLGDRSGRRRALVAGLALFAAGSLLCLVAPTVEWLLAGRVVQALGPPLTLPATLAIVTQTFADPAARARAVGLWGAGSGIGLTLGPLLGGLVVTGVGWRWLFGINLPVCALLVWLALRGIPRDRPGAPAHPFDGAAALLLTATVALAVFGLIEGRELGWTSPAVLGAFAVAALLGAAFVRRELGHVAPLVDVRLLTERSFLAANLGGAAMFGALTGSAVFISIFLQEQQDRTALETGLMLLPQGALTAAGAPVAGRMVNRFGARVPILVGLAVTTVGFLALLRFDESTSLLDAWWTFALVGLGTGLAMPPMTVIALAAAPAARAGMASAIHNASRQLGQTFAVAVLGTIVFSQAAYLDGLHAALAVTAAGLLATGVLLAVLVPR